MKAASNTRLAVERGNCTSSKRAMQKELRRNEIIEAGLQEFTAQGFSSTRLEDVAERAGIGKGTIYLYFDSKESLFEEVIRQNLFPGRDEAENQAEVFTGSAEELLILHTERMYALSANEKIAPLLAMVIGEGSRFPQLSEFFFNEMVGRNRELMSRIIKRGIERGEFKKTGIEDYTQILISPILISALWKLQFDAHAPLDMEVFAKIHIDFMLRGLKA